MRSKRLTTVEVSKRTGWSLQKIRTLIHSGRLKAVDTSTGKKARFEIYESDLDEFLEPKTFGDAEPPKPARRRRRLDADVEKVFA